MANDPQTYALGYEGPEVQEILEKSDDIGPATQSKDGLMSAADKEKLDGVNTGAQANVIEQIEVGGVILEPSSKKVIIPVDAAAAQGGANPVSSGALYAALLNYYTSAEVDQLIAGIKQFTYEVVAELPTASADTMYCIYFVPSTNPETQNVKDEFITVRSGEEGSYTYSWEQVGSTEADISGKADKDTDAVEGNLAEFDANGNPVDSGISSEKIGEIEEEVSVLRNSAGVAEGIADTLSAGTAQEIMFRQSGGDGVNYIKRLKGKSLVWNQLVQNGNFADTSAWGVNNCTMSVANNIATIVSSAASHIYQISGNIAAGHKFLCVFTARAVSGSVSCRLRIFCEGQSTDIGPYDLSSSFATHKQIVTIAAGSGIANGFYFLISGESTVEVKNVVCIDLTLMFGAGDEPTTVEEFEALYPEAYHPYNAGSIVSNDAEALESVGRNLWDEEWEVGSFDARGNPSASANAIRSKNYIPIIGGLSYYAMSANTWLQCYAYDADKNYLMVWGSDGVNPIKLPNEARYIKFRTSTAYGPTYNHDICINLSDDSFNGQYEPYWKRRVELGITTRKDTDGNVPFVEGMMGAGTAHDWCDRVGGEKVMGEVDLGDFTFQKQSTSKSHSRWVTNIPGMKGVAENTVTANIIAVGYATGNANQVYIEYFPKAVAITRAGELSIYDDTYKDVTSASDFKAAMSGVKLIFERATPVPFTWAEPLPNSILVDNLGTEQAVFPVHNDETPSAPFACDSNYSISVKNLVAFINAQNNG